MTTPSTRLPPARRLRILFAIPHLARDGGAERVLLMLLEHIDRTRFEPGLMVLDAGRNALGAALPDDVALEDLGVSRVRYAWRPILATLRRRRPDVLMSGLGHLNLLIGMMRSMLPPGLAVVGRETAVVTSFNAEFRTAALRNFAYRRFYPNLDFVVCQSQDMQADLVERLGFDAQRTRLIANPVDIARVRTMAARPDPAAAAAFGTAHEPMHEPMHRAAGDAVPPLKLVAVGRLMPQKGFDLLIDAIGQLPRGRCRVVILGDGPQRAMLQRAIDERGLQRDVVLAGYQPNPYAFMRAADAMVLSSRYEGLPNVVLECLAAGTPVIATPCPGGTREIAARTGGVALADDVSAAALAAAIDRFVDDRDRAVRFANGIDIDAYRLPGIVRQYEAVLEEAAAAAGRRVGR